MREHAVFQPPHGSYCPVCRSRAGEQDEGPAIRIVFAAVVIIAALVLSGVKVLNEHKMTEMYRRQAVALEHIVLGLKNLDNKPKDRRSP